MKKVLSLLLLSSVVLFGSNYVVEVGYKTTAYDYSEYDVNSALLDTEESNIGDINGLYLRLKKALWKNEQGGDDSIEFAYSYTEGNTDYIGSILGSGNSYGSYLSSTANEYIDLELNYIREFHLMNLNFSTTLGLGYYEWERALSVTQIEVYSWYYTKLALGVSENFYENWNLGLDLAWQYAFKEEMEANLPGVISSTFDLGRTYTLKAAIPLTIPLTQTINFTSKLEYEQTKIGKSNTINGFFEPRSKQKNIHLYFGLIFKL